MAETILAAAALAVGYAIGRHRSARATAEIAARVVVDLGEWAEKRFGDGAGDALMARAEWFTGSMRRKRR